MNAIGQTYRLYDEFAVNSVFPNLSNVIACVKGNIKWTSLRVIPYILLLEQMKKKTF